MRWIPPPFAARPEQMMGSKSRMQGKVPSHRGAAAPVYIGIDVYKARLDVHIHPVGESLVLPNDAGGLKRLKKILARHDDIIVVMEATGKIHRQTHPSP